MWRLVWIHRQNGNLGFEWAGDSLVPYSRRTVNVGETVTEYADKINAIYSDEELNQLDLNNSITTNATNIKIKDVFNRANQRPDELRAVIDPFYNPKDHAKALTFSGLPVAWPFLPPPNPGHYKFKVGDNVRILKVTQQSFASSAGAENYIGRVGRIIGIHNNAYSNFPYVIKFPDSSSEWGFREDELELVGSSVAEGCEHEWVQQQLFTSFFTVCKKCKKEPAS